MNSIPSRVSVARRRRAAQCVARSVRSADTRRRSTMRTSRHPATRRSSRASVDFGQRRHRVGAQQPRRDDRPGDVAVLDDAHGLPSRQQAVHEHSAEGVAGAEPAHHLDVLRRNDRRCRATWRPARRRRPSSRWPVPHPAPATGRRRFGRISRRRQRPRTRCDCRRRPSRGPAPAPRSAVAASRSRPEVRLDSRVEHDVWLTIPDGQHLPTGLRWRAHR